jgi:hypothetical protein
MMSLQSDSITVACHIYVIAESSRNTDTASVFLLSFTVLMSDRELAATTSFACVVEETLALLDSEMESIGLRSSCQHFKLFFKATLAHSTNHFVVLSLIKGYY